MDFNLDDIETVESFDSTTDLDNIETVSSFDAPTDDSIMDMDNPDDIEQKVEDLSTTYNELSTTEKKPNLRDTLVEANKPTSYAEINTMGMDYPERSFSDVLTGKYGTPEELQAKVVDDYLAKKFNDKGIEDVSDILLDVVPMFAGIKLAKNVGKGAIDLSQADNLRDAPKSVEYLRDLIMKHNPDVKTSDVDKILKDVPRKDQARVLAEQGGNPTSGLFKQAVQTSEEAISGEIRTLTDRSRALEKVSGSQTVEEVSKTVGEEFENMRKLVKETSIDPNASFNGEELKSTITELGNIADNELAKKRITSLLSRMEKTDLTVDDALDIRRRVNYELGKAQGSDYDQWEAVKEEVDSFITDNSSPKMKELIDLSNESYKRMKNQEELNTLIAKNTNKNSAGTIGESGGVNWVQLKKDIKDNKLESPEVDAVVDMVDDFSKKFGDNDFKYSNAISPKGAAGETATLAGTAEGIITARAARGIVEWVGDLFKTDKKAVYEIAKSIKKNNDPLGLVKDIEASKNIPKDIKDKFSTLTKEVKAEDKAYRDSPVGKATKRRQEIVKQTREDSEDRIKAVQFSDTEKEKVKVLQNKQNFRNSAERIVDQAEEKVNSLEDSISALEDRLTTTKSPNKVKAQIIAKEKKLSDAKKSLVLKKDNHSKRSNDFDKEVKKSGFELNEMDEFVKPRKANPRSQKK